MSSIERVSEELYITDTACHRLFTIDHEVQFLLYEVRNAVLDALCGTGSIAEDYAVICVTDERMSAFLQFLVKFIRSGRNGPPCGVPTLLSCTIPLTIDPAFRYLCISDITLPSLIVKDSRRSRKL